MTVWQEYIYNASTRQSIKRQRDATNLATYNADETSFDGRGNMILTWSEGGFVPGDDGIVWTVEVVDDDDNGSWNDWDDNDWDVSARAEYLSSKGASKSVARALAAAWRVDDNETRDSITYVGWRLEGALNGVTFDDSLWGVELNGTQRWGCQGAVVGSILDSGAAECIRDRLTLEVAESRVYEPTN